METKKKISYLGINIFIGLDVHNKQWTVTIIIGDEFYKTIVQPPDAVVLGNYLRRNFPDAKYYSVYEAGYCGYWVHYALEDQGIQNIIVNPADVPTMHKQRRRKRDPSDSKKLAKQLMNGDLESIYIRNKQLLEDRALVRSRSMLVKDQTRYKNRIKGLIANFGFQITDEKVKSYWSRKYINYLLDNINNYGGFSITLKTLIEELLHLREQILKVTREIRKLSAEERYSRNVGLLTKIKGISILSSMVILTELGDLNKYRTLDKLASYAGIVPDESSSGEKENKLGITRRCNKHLKRVLIESSWIAVRNDPALMLAFINYNKRNTLKTKSIIKIARKLLNRIRYVLTTGQEYQILTI
jgi:transposase